MSEEIKQDLPQDDLEPGTTSEPGGIADAEGEAAAVQSTEPVSVEQELSREDAAAEQEAASTAEATPAPEPAPETGLSAKQKADSAKADTKKKEEASLSPFSVTVGTVYDGPLDLLLDLIRKQDIDIYDIPIARVTKQFLAYVENLKQTDVDSAADFIYTASLLIHIKSKMLLPRDPSDVTGGEAEDPRRELVERLLEHERFKAAAQMLMQKQQVEEATWTNPGMREFHNAPGTEPEFAADTMDLVRIFQEILDRMRERPVLNVNEESVTVAQMLDYVKRRMVMEDKPVSLRKLLHSTHSERALICMFLALLELVRLQAILLKQENNFADILIKKSDGFDAVISEQTQVHDDWK
ncbi:MAG TPA: segregation/condensation protein A [Acidobacteriaceae bacterium]